jgi:diguanylate cyclase (GGDEF)-like protein
LIDLLFERLTTVPLLEKSTAEYRARATIVVLLIFNLFYSELLSANSQPKQLSQSSVQSLLKSQNSPETVLHELKAIEIDTLSSNRAKAEHLLLICEINNLLAYPERAVAAAEQARTYASEFDHPWLFHKLNIAYANALDLQGSPEDGIPLVVNALKWAESSNMVHLVVDARLTLGMLKTSLFEYVDALDNLQKAYSLAAEKKQSEYPLAILKGDITGSIALLYEYRREDALALPFFQQSVNFHRRQNNQMQLSIALYGLGRANLKLNNRRIGKEQLNEALVISLTLQDQQGVAYALRALASAEMRDNNYAKAKQLQEKAHPIFAKSNNTHMLFDFYQMQARIAIKMDDFDGAKQAIRNARKSIENKSMPLKEFTLSGIESEWLAETGEFEKAYKLLLKSEEQKAKFNRSQSTEKFHQQRAKYELTVKEKENALQKLLIEQGAIEANSLYQVVAALLVICCLLFLLIFRSWRHKKVLQALANTDSLTNLLNRRATLLFLDKKLSECKGVGGNVTVAIADLDKFKKVNDTLGHSIGDHVIASFAEVALSNTRLGDVVGRIGGEEFLLILAETDLKGAQIVLDKIRKGTHSIGNSIPELTWPVSVSIGMAEFNEGESAKELIHRADKALYQAKSLGRDQIAH